MIPARIGRIGLALLAALALTLSAGGQAAKLFGPWSLAPLFAIYFLAAFRLDRLAAWAGRLAPWLIACLVAALSAAFVVVFPLADSGAFGPGSDRDEALNLAAAALFEGRPLYAAPTYLENPITPLPGAVLLAAPFAALGEAAWQNLFWLPVLAALAVALLGRAAAAAYLALFVAANPGFLQDFLSGGDYAVNAVYAAAALALALRLAEGRAGAALGGAVLGLVILSRPIHLLALVVAGGVVRRRFGRRAATLVVVALGVAAALGLGALALGTEGFAPLHFLRFTGTSAGMAAVLAALALAATAPAFLRPLGTLDAIGVFALGLAALLIPPALAHLPEVEPRLFGLTTPVALVGGLWLARRLAARDLEG